MDLKPKIKNFISALLYVGTIFFVMLAIVAVSGVIYGCFTLDSDADEIPEWFTIESTSIMLYIPVTLIFTVLFIRQTRYQTELVHALHTKKKRWLLYAFLFGVLIQMAKYALLSNLSANFYYVPLNNSLHEILEDFLRPDHFLSFLCVCVFCPPVEELLCRFFFPLHFRQAFSQYTAIFFSAAIFTSLHYSRSQLLFPLYLLDSYLFYLLYSRTYSVLCAILMHTGMNFYTTVVKYAEFHYINVSVPFFIVAACLVLLIVIALVRKPNLLIVQQTHPKSPNNGTCLEDTIAK